MREEMVDLLALKVGVVLAKSVNIKAVEGTLSKAFIELQVKEE